MEQKCYNCIYSGNCYQESCYSTIQTICNDYHLRLQQSNNLTATQNNVKIKPNQGGIL